LLPALAAETPQRFRAKRPTGVPAPRKGSDGATQNSALFAQDRRRNLQVVISLTVATKAAIVLELRAQSTLNSVGGALRTDMKQKR
jgi:hypothetical protein